MKYKLKPLHSYVFIFLHLGILIGLLYSMALLSICASVLILFGLFQISNSGVIPFGNKFIVVLFLLFILSYALSLLYSSDQIYGWKQFKNTCLLSLVLLSLWNSEQIYRQYKELLNAYLVILFSSTIWTSYQSIQLLDSVQEIYTVGQVFPTIISHILYSLMLAFACFICSYLFIQSKGNNILQLVYATGFLWFSTLLHFLAVRSGLFGFYLALISILILWGIHTRKVKQVGIILLIIASFAFLSIKTIPSLKSKLEYTSYSLKIFKTDNEKAANYSDPVRLTSMKLGLQIIQENPFLGVGIGDLKTVMNEKYSVQNPSWATFPILEPHNQFLFSYASAGILSFLLLISICVHLLYYYTKSRNYLMISFNIILISFFSY